MDGHAGAALLEDVEERGQVQAALAHRGPLHGDAVGGLPDHVVAEAGGEDVGRERFEAGERVFERPRGVAGVEVHAHVILAGGLDELLQLPRLHVAGVVFDGDFDARVHRAAALGLEHLHRVGDARLDAALGAAVLLVAEDDAEGL